MLINRASSRDYESKAMTAAKESLRISAKKIVAVSKSDRRL
jgi:hypothetical protein